jgi:citrate lyase subunit beta/citryl-CoA lyase
MLHEDIWGRSAKAVRINAVSSPFASDDIATVVGKAGGKLDTIFLSKPETVDEIQWRDKLAAIVPLAGFENAIGYVVGIESAQALTNIDRLACSANIEALGFAIGDPECIAWCAYRRLYYGPVFYPGDLFHFTAHASFSPRGPMACGRWMRPGRSSTTMRPWHRMHAGAR